VEWTSQNHYFHGRARYCFYREIGYLQVWSSALSASGRRPPTIPSTCSTRGGCCSSRKEAGLATITIRGSISSTYCLHRRLQR
jgi:hypothetical protein